MMMMIARFIRDKIRASYAYDSFYSVEASIGKGLRHNVKSIMRTCADGGHGNKSTANQQQIVKQIHSILTCFCTNCLTSLHQIEVVELWLKPNIVCGHPYRPR